MGHLPGEMGRIMHSSSPWPAAGEGLQVESSWLGLAALHGLIIPLGEGQVGSSKGSSCYRLSHITLSCQSLQKSFGMSWRGAGAANPPPSAVIPTVAWSNAINPSTSPCSPVPALHPPSPSPHCALLPHPSRTGQATVLSHRSKCPSREGFSCSKAA